MYREISQGIEVVVEPEYVPERSFPEKNYFYFAYRVKISNLSDSIAQLMERKWVITDGFGIAHEVRGPGVIGEQPQLEPGEFFEYTSFCPLPTPTGNMRGTYRMVDEVGKEFEVKIPLFFLRDLRNVH